MRILFTTVALSGHAFPTIQLALACQAAGHEVLVVTTDNYLGVLADAGLPGASCGRHGGLRDLRGAEAVRFGAVAGTELGAARQRRAHGLALAGAARRAFPVTLEQVRRWRPSVVVSERAEFAGPLAAYRCAVPSAELHWGMAPLAEFAAAAARELSAELAAAGLSGLPRPRLVLNPWPPSLRQGYAAHHASVRLGPHRDTAPLPDCVRAGDATPLVCLTLGTVLPALTGGAVPEFVDRLTHRLAGAGLGVVLAVDDDIAARWRRWLPAAVRFAGRVPLGDTLARCVLSVNHGGQGTTLAALGAACPQVVLPQFDDQFDNADAVAKAGAGVRLLPAELTAGAVARACDEVLGGAGYRAAARRVAAQVAAMPSAARAVHRIVALATG